MFDSIFPILPEVVDPNGIGLRLDDVEELGAYFNELTRVDFAFKDGVLHALSVVEAGLGGSAEAGSTSGGSGADVVGDEDNHFI